MRELINILESILLTEKSRGLLYRTKGDRFFTGKKDNPTQSIVFEKTEYFPGMPGAYDTHEDMLLAYQELETTLGSIEAVNKPTSAMNAFAVLTLLDEKTKRPFYVARFFNQIKPDMTGAWKNSEIPGGFQLDKETSLKAGYGLKPSDIFPSSGSSVSFKNINQLLQAFKQSETAQPFVPGFEMLYGRKPQFPVFTGADEYFTAIRDDLGEIIGPVALIQNLDMGTGAKAAARDLLDGGDWSGSSIRFPSGKTNGLVDSYIVTSNGVEVGISSKGEKGATASVKNISDGVKYIRTTGTDEQKKLLKKYADQIKTIETISNSTTIGFPIQYALQNGMISQEVADIIPQLIKTGAKTLDGLPIGEDTLVELTNLIGSKGAKTELPNYSVGYHLLSAIAQVVAEDINSDPKFGEACLKFLNSSPTMQLHASATKQKDGDVAITGFTSKYPPNFKGTVELDASKNYSATAAGGRMNFAYNGADAGLDSEGGGAMSSPALSKVASKIVEPEIDNQRVRAFAKPEPKAKAVSGAGRKKRKTR